MTNFDVTYKNNGFGAHAAFGSIEVTAAGEASSLLGDVSFSEEIEADFMTLQLSYFINDDWQLYATYEEVDLDLPAVIDYELGKDDNMIIGANTWYSDDCKVTIEYEDETFNAGEAGDSRLSAQVQFTF
jgi:predicted porin